MASSTQELDFMTFVFVYGVNVMQIIGGAVLHDGSIAEMKTGEGKTLVSTLAAYLNALTGDGVHGMFFVFVLASMKLLG